MSKQSKKNRRSLQGGKAMRNSHLDHGGRSGDSRLIPVVANHPSKEPVDGAALAAELAALNEMARRGFST